MSPARAAAALVAGLVLGSLPAWRYAPGVLAPAAHADHEPHHGGQLGMAGDHHVELVRRAGRLEAYVSDAWRRPVRSDEAWLVVDHARRLPLRREEACLVAAAPAAVRDVEVIAVLADGTRLRIAFDLGG